MTIKFGNADDQLFGGILTAPENFVFGNGNDDHINILSRAVNVSIKMGNGAGDSVSVDGGHDNAFTLGNGAHDSVFFGGSFGADHTSITLGNGDYDHVTVSGGASFCSGDTITMGDGANDSVTLFQAGGCTVKLGNGNGDVVDDIGVQGHNSITVGSGNNDAIGVGVSDTITVLGVGADSFVFRPATSPGIGQVIITGFDPVKDNFVFSDQVTTASAIAWHDDIHGNAVISPDANPTDTITLLGVHSADLHQSNFEVVADPMLHHYDMI